MYVCTFLGLQTNGVVNGLVTNNLIRGNIHEADWLRRSDYSGDLLIDSELFHLFISLLCHDRHRRKSAQKECDNGFECLHFYDVLIVLLLFSIDKVNKRTVL